MHVADFAFGIEQNHFDVVLSCKPVSDNDLAHCLADCLDMPHLHNRVLPIGGPGEAITPRQIGAHLFALLRQAPRFKQVPVALLDVLITVLSTAGHVVPALAAKAELARIGRYYATESMLVLDQVTGSYGAAAPERGDHAVF